MSLKVGALFAGYGGLELALSSVLDAEPAWFSEFDKAPSRVLAHHWPDVPNLGDVTKIDWATVEPVDIITGGSPCQDLSHAGKRAGMKAGTRSGLWASMCDAIDIIRPKLVVWENVRGALSAEADSAVEPCPICVGDGGRVTLRALGRVLGDLAELRYDARWYGLRAADVGAAHGRFRVFVFATPAEDSECWTGRAQQGERPTAAEAARPGQAGESGGSGLPSVTPGQLTLLKTPTSQLAVNGGSQHPDKRKDGGHGPTLADEVEHLLPTPGVAGGGKKVPEDAVWSGNAAYKPDGTKVQVHLDYIAEQRLMPTPRATDGTKGGPNQRGSSGDLMLPSAVTLLPTVTSQAAKHAGGDTDRGAGSPDDANLWIIAQRMWGTDATADQADADEDLRDVWCADGAEAVREAPRGLGCVHAPSPLLPVVREHTQRGDEGRAPLAGQEAQGDSVRGVCHDCGPACASQGSEPGEQRPNQPDDALLELPPAAALAGGPSEADGGREEGPHNRSQEWGEYEAAIRRWEMVLGRPAPNPTSPGAKGQPRLSAAFCEWLMGLPEGHVTDPAIDISRNDQLKALGNGVVPQQCAAALRAFLADTAKAATA